MAIIVDIGVNNIQFTSSGEIWKAANYLLECNDFLRTFTIYSNGKTKQFAYDDVTQFRFSGANVNYTYPQAKNSIFANSQNASAGGGGGGGGDASAANQVAGNTVLSDIQTLLEGFLKTTARTDTASNSGTITTGGTAQVLLAANTNRIALEIYNNSTGNLTLKFGGTATATADIILKADDIYVSPANACTTKSISVFGATTGQKFSYVEYSQS